jgi:nitrite reductase/ring-hydroxylating ferredoxin subunit/Fe-S cluster biogenesis protein NfuA
MSSMPAHAHIEAVNPRAEGDAGAQRLAELAGDIVALENIARAWPDEQQAAVERLKAAIQALHREGLLRLIRGLREDAAAAARLKHVVRDPLVFGMLRLHGLVRDPLETRVRAALVSVEPFLAQHGGGVELVAVRPPDTVEIRLTGACQGCPASGQTLREGVERAIAEYAPEIAKVVPVGGGPIDATTIPLHFTSPFARAADAGFIDVCALSDLPIGKAQVHKISDREVLLYRDHERIGCVDNMCAHMGRPLDGGEVIDAVIQCPHHGFRYRLDTGECLSVPEVQLVVHAVRVHGGRVAVKPAD